MNYYTQNNIEEIEIPKEILDILHGTITDDSTWDNTLKILSTTGILLLDCKWSPNIVVREEPIIGKDLTRSRISDLLYGKEELDKNIEELSINAPSIERIWRITEKLPSLTDILLKERNNE